MSVTQPPVTRDGDPLDTIGETGHNILFGEYRVIQLLEEIAETQKEQLHLMEMLISRL